MEPTNDWDRDEIFERIPWTHLSKDLGKLSVPPRVLGAVGVALVMLVGFVLVLRPDAAPAVQVAEPVAVAATTAPVVSAPVVLLPPSPISEADLFVEAPGAGELRAMTLAETHLRSVVSSDSVYVEWTSSFEVARVGAEWWVDVTAGVLKVEAGSYVPVNPIALRVGVDESGVVWSTPIQPVEGIAALDRIGGAEVSLELLAEFVEAVAQTGSLVEVVDAGLEEGSLWAIVVVETPDGVMLTLEVWPNRL